MLRGPARAIASRNQTILFPLSHATPRISQFAPDRSITKTRCLISRAPLAQHHTSTGGISPAGDPSARRCTGFVFGCRIPGREEEKGKGGKKREGGRHRGDLCTSRREREREREPKLTVRLPTVVSWPAACRRRASTSPASGLYALRWIFPPVYL